jgi:hypothetical protein
MAAKREFRSMRGKIVDMGLLEKKHELTPAVGNARVNARGDELGPGGKIIRKREEIVKEYYEAGTVQDETNNFRKSVVKTEDLTEDELKMLDDAAEDDSWIEDDTGNFIKKGK